MATETTPGPSSADAEVRSGGRLIGIVEMLSVARRPLSGREIGERLGIPTTTLHRIMGTLVRLRWVDRRPGGVYGPGPALLGLGGVVLGRSTLIQLARPILQQVADLSGLQSHLAVLAGRSVTYLARASGAGAEATDFKLGAVQPVHCTSAGKLLFALLPEVEEEEWLRSLVLRRYTSLTMIDQGEVRAELRRIRERGYSVDPGEYNDFWRSVAVPVLGTGQRPVAAITCGGPPEKMTIEHQGRMRQEMTLLADELSHQLA